MIRHSSSAASHREDQPYEAMGTRYAASILLSACTAARHTSFATKDVAPSTSDLNLWNQLGHPSRTGDYRRGQRNQRNGKHQGCNEQHMHVFVRNLLHCVGCWLVRHRGRRMRGHEGTRARRDVPDCQTQTCSCP